MEQKSKEKKKKKIKFSCDLGHVITGVKRVV